jgi:hypothetical protein
MMPIYHLVQHIVEDFVNYRVSQVDYNRILEFGTLIFFVVVFSIILLGRTRPRKKVNNIEYQPRLINKKYIYIAFIVFFALTAFSHVTGIAKMGAEPVYLPFHLGGIINLSRRKVAPILFILLMENYYLNEKKIPSRYFIIYFVWVIIEAFVCMSKGAVVNLTLPLFIVYFLYKRPTFKQSISITIPVIMIFLFLYPIIGIMRHGDGDFMESFSSAKSAASAESGSVINLLELKTILNRAFMTGFQYSVDYKYIDHDQIFDFSRVPILLAYGGSQRFQTHVIDGYPINAINSSGTTGLIDPLLHGGVGFCVIVVLLIILFANFADNASEKKQYSIYAQLLIMLWGFCNSNISKFYDSIGMQSLLVSILCIFISYRLNFRIKKRIIVKNINIQKK